MHLIGVPLMIIEKYKLALMAKAFTPAVVDYMIKNEDSKGFNIGVNHENGHDKAIGVWNIDYSLPSIFQRESYDLKMTFEYYGESGETKANKISQYFFVFSKMKTFVNFCDLSAINNYMKLSDNFYRAVAKYKNVSKFHNISIKVKFDEKECCVYTQIPYVSLKDGTIVLNARDILFKGHSFHVEQDSNMRKYSIKYFPDYVFELYSIRIIADINEILEMDLCIKGLTKDEIESLIIQYTSVVEMMYT
jgi:hypothetical protein